MKFGTISLYLQGEAASIYACIRPCWSVGVVEDEVVEVNS